MSRLIVVSGAASGIGRATARRFAAGDRLCLVGRREAPLTALARELGARAVVADLATIEGARAVAEAIGEETVDVIVAAAGGTPATTPSGLGEVSRDWNADLQQNLMTAVLLVEALKPRLARPGGRVLGLGSIGAQLGSGYGGSYGAAKAALQAWIFWLAQDLGSSGVTANLVVPGYVPDTEFFGDRVTNEFHRARVERSLVRRAGTADEVAATIEFLASADAGYITGQLIGVNGGMVLGR